MRKVAITAVLALASCSGRGEIIPTPSPEPNPPTTVEAITSAALVAAPTTTEAPVTTTTEPEPPTTRVRASTTTSRYLQPEATTETGAWAIPTYIVMCESGGNWNAYNPGSGASGPYQLMPMHFGGELAMNQSRAAQHAKAAELWNGGRGKSHWAACL